MALLKGNIRSALLILMILALPVGCHRQRKLDERGESAVVSEGPSSSVSELLGANTTTGGNSTSPGSTTFSTAQTSMNRVQTRLRQECEHPLPRFAALPKWHGRWRETWLPSFDAVLNSAVSPEVERGEMLPPEVRKYLNDPRSAVDIFSKDEVEFVDDRSEFEAAYALMLIAISVCQGSGSEVPVFLDRADSIPPLRGDVIIFKAMSEGLMYLENPTVLGEAEVAKWQRLASAKNAVYRLIAARTFHLVSSDLAQCSEIYRSLLGDSDPSIARIAVTGASRFATNETPAALQEFRERQSRLGNVSLADAATKALIRIKRHR